MILLYIYVGVCRSTNIYRVELIEDRLNIERWVGVEAALLVDVVDSEQDVSVIHHLTHTHEAVALIPVVV